MQRGITLSGLLAFSALRVLTSSVLSFNASLRAAFSQYILQKSESIIFKKIFLNGCLNEKKKKPVKTLHLILLQIEVRISEKIEEKNKN